MATLKFQNLVQLTLFPTAPLIETNPKLEMILADGYAKSNLPKGSFGSVNEFLPLNFSK